MGLLIGNKTKHKRRVLTEAKLDDIGAELQCKPRKPLNRLAQVTGVSKSSTKTATQLLKIRSYKARVIHGRLADAQSNYQGLIWQFVLQSVIEGELDPQLTFFS
jgi:hypothetical protein